MGELLDKIMQEYEKQKLSEDLFLKVDKEYVSAKKRLYNKRLKVNYLKNREESFKFDIRQLYQKNSLNAVKDFIQKM